MSTVKYQIFLSSTFVDLQDERNEVIKAILEMGHIPVGMEMFSAADEEQWKLIARQIDQSDYYVVIVAHRYGSVAGRVSYTEKEYDYAVAQSVPVIGFVIDDSAPWPKDRIDNDQKKVKLLEKFKNKVKRKPVNFWSSKDDLHSKVAISLMKAFVTNPRPGWIRASETVNPEVINELSRLSSENAQLRSQLEALQLPNTSGFAQGDVCANLKITYNDTYYNRNTLLELSWSWDELFEIIGTTIIDNPDELTLKYALHNYIRQNLDELKQSGEIQAYADFEISETEFSKVKTQFMALGYIDFRAVTRSDNPRAAFVQWYLTPLGNRKLSDLLAIRNPK